MPPIESHIQFEKLITCNKVKVLFYSEMNSKSLTVLMAFMVLMSIVSMGYSCNSCYTTGRVCGWALGCGGGIYQCGRVGGTAQYLGPCSNGCIKSSPNHYCFRLIFISKQILYNNFENSNIIIN